MRARSPLCLAWIAFISGRCSCIRCIEWICRTVSGTSSIRTVIVSATIDHAQVRPKVVWSPSSAQVRTSSIGERMLRKAIIETASGPRPCPARRGSRGYSGEAARRRGSSRARVRTDAGRRWRTASRTGGTCTSQGRAHPASSGRRTRLRSRRTSRACLAENFLETLAHPLGAAALLGLAEGRPHEQDVVRAGRHVGDELTPALAETALDPVAGHRAPDLLGDRDPEAHVTALVILSIEPVEDEVAGRDGTAVPVDGVEVARAGEAVAALHGCGAAPATRKGASGRARAAVSGWRGRPSKTSAGGSHADASVDARWADRSVSRFQ